jgi:hypothetical protein
MCKQLLPILKRDQENGCHMVITGDENWFYFSYDYEGALTLDLDELPVVENRTIQSKKLIFTVLWNPD